MSKMSSSHIIDLDKYVFKNDSMSRNRLDAQTDVETYLDEYPSLDSEIIDYGICEEQDEDCKEMSTTEKTLKTESLKENALRGASLKPVNVHSCCTKPALVKVVDCDKFPWYYTKYKDQILKRKYRNALDHARNIMKYLEESLAEEGDNSISALYQKSAITKKIMTLTEELRRSELNSSNMDNRTLSQKPVQVAEKYSGASKVDIKKNTGLIGLKVQRASSETLEEKNSVKKKVCEEKLHKRNKMLSSLSNRKVQNVHDGDQTVSHVIKENKLDRSKKTKRSHDTLSQKNKTKTHKSDCSDIHKVKDYTKKTIHQDAIEDHSDFKETMRYKPMPKSKKVALEKRRTIENKNVLTTPKEEVKYQLSTQHEHLTILKKNTIISTYSRKENAEPIKKSFDKLNKFTGKVMKILSCPKTKGNDSIHYNKKFKSKDLNSFNYQKIKNDSTKINTNANKYMPTVRSNSSNTTVISAGPTVDSLNMQPVYVNTKILKPNKNDGYEKKLSHRSLFGTSLPPKVIDGNEKYDARNFIASMNHKDNVKDYAVYSSQISSSHDNQQKQTVLSKRKPVCGNQILNIEDDIKTKPISNPSDKPIASEPLDPAEYIVPDVIYPLQTPYKSNIQTKTDINKATHDLIAPLPAPIQNISVADKSSTAQKTPLTTTNIQTLDITRPLAKTSMQPHILKRALQAPPRSQQQTPILSAVLPSHLSSPRYTAPSLVNIRPTTPHQYQAPRKLNQTPYYQFNTHNVQAMPVYQQTAVNYNSNQKNCGQPPFGTLNYINMPFYNVQAPVQTYNVMPAYDYYGINFYDPAQPSQNLPPPNYINNITSNCSIIGKNDTGFVKKINIPILQSTDGERQINRKDGIYGKSNVTLNTTSIDVVTNVEVGNETIAKFLSETPVLSDSTLTKEKTNTAIGNAKSAESKDFFSESSNLLLDQHKPNQRKQFLTNNKLETLNSLNQDTTVKTINKFKLQKEVLGSSKTELKKNIEKIQENITNATILDTNKFQNEQPLHEGIKGYTQKDTTSKITEIELASIPLPDILPQKSETKTLNRLKRPPTNDSKVENKNIFRYNRPGPLSKKIKLHNFAEGVKTPPREFQKIPACKGYSPPILPIPTYEILLSEAKEKYASYASKEKPSVQYEKRKTPLILGNNLKKSTKLPESPKGDTTKKISLEEYKNRNLKEQKRKNLKENETN